MNTNTMGTMMKRSSRFNGISPSCWLELKKIYKAIPDEDAAKKGLLRVEDESHESYLYPSDFFMPIKVPHALEEALSHVKD